MYRLGPILIETVENSLFVQEYSGVALDSRYRCRSIGQDHAGIELLYMMYYINFIFGVYTGRTCLPMTMIRNATSRLSFIYGFP